MLRKLILLVILFVLTSIYAFSSGFEIAFSNPLLIQNNHVGNEWQQFFIINSNSYSIYTSHNFELPNGSFPIQVVVVEEDGKPDIGSTTVLIDPRELTIQKQMKYEVVVTVTENGGRYKDNTAQWELSFTVKFIE